MVINLRKILGNDKAKSFSAYIFSTSFLEYEHVGGLFDPMGPTRSHHKLLKNQWSYKRDHDSPLGRKTCSSRKGAFNNYVDKKRGRGVSQKSTLVNPGRRGVP